MFLKVGRPFALAGRRDISRRAAQSLPVCPDYS
jgi:hypothetical protein